MSMGLKITNPTTGTVVIDANYSNLGLVSKGSVNSWTYMNYDSLYYATVTYASTQCPIMVVQCSTQKVSIYTVRNSGSVSWTIVKDNSTAATVSYWIFDVPPPASSVALPPMGVIINNTSGVPVYRSDYKYMRVAAMIPPPSSNTTTTLTSGRSYAFSPTSDPWGQFGDSDGSVYLWMWGAQISSNVVTSGFVGYPYSTLPKTTGQLVVDVTGY